MTKTSKANVDKEANRIEALKKYDILDTPPDGTFDNFTQLAARLLRVPIAIISLVDTDRIWFKSRYGLDVTQITREPGLCSSAILSDDLYVVEDALNDPRTLTNPLVVGSLGLRFYAAIPLKTWEGYSLGTLCVIDKEPRKLTEEQEEVLELLGKMVMDQMELRLSSLKAIAQQNQMVNMIAHDLKNPLTGIPIRAELIKESKGNPEVTERLCDQIKTAGLRMAQIVNDFLAVSKMEANKIDLKFKKVNFSHAIKQVVKLNNDLALNKGQVLDLNLLDRPFIYGDEDKIRAVADNLISNAIKYSPKKEVISVTVKELSHQAILEVKDNGPGLIDYDKKHLFDRFSRLSAQPTGGETSTGLGLSIVKTLVETHNGTVKAESAGKGKGSTFTVAFPAYIDNLQYKN